VKHRAPALNAPVVAASDNPVIDDQDRTDWDAALGQPDAGFGNRGSEVVLAGQVGLAPKLFLNGRGTS
jgi:hypothetical protein